MDCRRLPGVPEGAGFLGRLNHVPRDCRRCLGRDYCKERPEKLNGAGNPAVTVSPVQGARRAQRNSANTAWGTDLHRVWENPGIKWERQGKEEVKVKKDVLWSSLSPSNDPLGFS